MSEKEPEYLPAVETVPVIESLTKGEMETKLEIAKRYPRKISAFRDTLMSHVLASEEIAEECFYTLTFRGGAPIEGPAAPFAELVAAEYGNCVAGARVLSTDGEFVTAQGVFHDLEKNSSVSLEVSTPIVGKNGKRYSPDMVRTTALATIAKAYRNAVLKGVPRVLWRPAYDAARQLAIGNAESLGSKRSKMIETFGKAGISKERITHAMHRDSVEQITLDDLAKLRGMYNAIKEGDAKPEEAFPDPSKTDTATATAALRGDTQAEEQPPKRGRPKGSKNKPKPKPEEPNGNSQEPVPAPQEAPDGIDPGATDGDDNPPPPASDREEKIAIIEKYLTRRGAMGGDTFLDAWGLVRANWREANDATMAEMVEDIGT